MNGLKKPIRGVLFDMDGVILDTEWMHARAWKQVFDTMKIPADDAFLISMRGANMETQKRLFAEAFGDSVNYAEARALRGTICDAIFQKEGIKAKPGYRELIAWLDEKKIPRALCTSTARDKAEEELPMAGLKSDFAAYVTGTEPAHGKPAPDTFLLGAQKLGLKPEECIVFEDSPNGICAGSAAGCQVIMVPDTVQPTPELEAMCAAVCGSLLEARDLMIAILGFD